MATTIDPGVSGIKIKYYVHPFTYYQLFWKNGPGNSRDVIWKKGIFVYFRGSERKYKWNISFFATEPTDPMGIFCHLLEITCQCKNCRWLRSRSILWKYFGFYYRTNTAVFVWMVNSARPSSEVSNKCSFLVPATFLCVFNCCLSESHTVSPPLAPSSAEWPAYNDHDLRWPTYCTICHKGKSVSNRLLYRYA